MKRQRGFVVMPGAAVKPAANGVGFRSLSRRLRHQVSAVRSSLLRVRPFVAGALIGAGIWAFIFAAINLSH
ncbi:MAG: hypothetical protein ABI854_10455 [Betaproteobacteria bacterium]